MGDGAAFGGRARHLPAHLSRCARREPGRRVHVAGPAVSRGRCSTRCGWPSTASTNCSQPRSNRVGATAEAQRLLGRARSELEFLRPGVLLESLENRLAGLQKTCRDVGEALALQYFHVRAVGGVDAMPASAARWSSRRRKSDVAHAGSARHRLCLQVAGDRLLQRSPADAALGLPAERHPQPRRDRSGDPVLPLRRLLGHRGDGVRPARAAHRARGDVVVGRGDRTAGAADGEGRPGATCDPRR